MVTPEIKKQIKGLERFCKKYGFDYDDENEIITIRSQCTASVQFYPEQVVKIKVMKSRPDNKPLRSIRLRKDDDGPEILSIVLFENGFIKVIL